MGMDVRPRDPLETSEGVGELGQSLVMSGKQVQLIEDFFVLQGGKTCTNGTRQLTISARLFSVLARS
jgi:hypothetical protein